MGSAEGVRTERLRKPGAGPLRDQPGALCTVYPGRRAHRLRTGAVNVQIWWNSLHSLQEDSPVVAESRMSSHLSLRLA
jgi:hypothetical protein